MKLMVQIPCLNEEETLPSTLRDIPRKIDGIDQIEVLIIDDGSTDRTGEVARENGADHILRFSANRGLGHAFAAGMDFCLRAGADIIVNTDGDNQYQGADIEKLVRPILERRAELVIGDRKPEEVEHFSFSKKMLQSIGSRTVSKLANLEVPDVASGFKAYSREAASRINMFTDFDHTVDHVIQAGRRRIPTVSVPIRTNEKLRDSRLFSSVGQFVARSVGIMLRVYSSYGAMRVFSLLGGASILLGVGLGLRFVYFFLFTAHHDLHVQSLILAAILMLAGLQMVLTGIVADLVNSSRSIQEDIAYRLRRVESDLSRNDGDSFGESS
ncbi:MAG TPA: glycosyltransferase family 2 protein [Myxococcales bacterium]|nr:glycosyltransferase family 2 protein [Myxococcales bacterium]HIL81266.1 glycosyltransferase family 2 protein [Myxococcales bacterium]